MFFIKLPPPAFARVGLVPFDMAARFQAAAKLNAAVTGVGGQFDFELQFKITYLQIADQELILFDSRRTSDDLAVFDRPELTVSIPARQVLTVEKQLQIIGSRFHGYLF